MENRSKTPVRVIPARQKKGKQSETKKQVKLRVAAYCRVSTELEEQESSYEAQVSHYTELISSKHEWVLAGIYADEGISGTSTAGREEFNRMIADCEAKKIDMIITKSISRFARNTLDCLKYIRKLKDLEIPVLFEKENINTLGMGGELLVTIMASLAQQESQSISQNVRMGIHYNFQKGRPMLNHNMFLGYTKERGGNLKIVPGEAAIVRRIFRDYLEGMSLGEIIFSLEEEGVRTPSGKGKWYHSTVTSMLKNEKYMGDLLLQKSYTADFLTKRKVRNTGTMPRYYVENAHAPIIPREIYMMTQAKLAQTERERVVNGRQERTTKNMSLNGKLVCGLCGASYRRYASEGEKEEAAVEAPDSKGAVWRCRTRVSKRHACLGPALSEHDVKAVVIAAFNRLPMYRDELIRMQERLRWGALEESSRRLRNMEAEKYALEKKLMEAEAGIAALEEKASEQELAAVGKYASPDTWADALHYPAQEDGKETAAGEPEEDALSLYERAEGYREELESLEEEINEESARKVGLAMQELQMQSALRLIDAISWNRDASSDKSDFCVLPGKPGYHSFGFGSGNKAPYESQERQREQAFRDDRYRGMDGNAGRGESPWGFEPDESLKDPAACSEVSDFYARTDNISQLGPVRQYSNDLVKRFVDKIIVYEDYLLVAFKAGVGIRIRKYGKR